MTQCYTCASNLSEIQMKFVLYQCIVCKEKTPYCVHCTIIVSKLLSPQVFKCAICNSITKIMTKEEVIFTNNDTYNERDQEREVLISPRSGFYSTGTPNKSMINNSFVFQTPKNNNSSFKEEDCINCINDFNKLNFTSTNKEDCLSQRYQLLQSRKSNITPRKSDLLNFSLSEKNNKISEFAGYNKKSKKITPISLRRQPNNEIIIPPLIAQQSKLASIAIQKINFSKGYDESEKPVYGVRCKLSDSMPQFNSNIRQIPNIISSSFKLN